MKEFFKKINDSVQLKVFIIILYFIVSLLLGSILLEDKNTTYIFICGIIAISLIIYLFKNKLKILVCETDFIYLFPSIEYDKECENIIIGCLNLMILISLKK